MDRIQKLITDYALSKRQADVLRELIKTPHATSEELAPRLSCSTSTVNVHFFKIFEKLSVKNKRELLQILEHSKGDLKPAVLSLQKTQVLFMVSDEAFAQTVIQLMGDIAPGQVAVHIVKSCEHGLSYLQKSLKPSSGAVRPHLIFMDLEVPVDLCLRVLQNIKADPFPVMK